MSRWIVPCVLLVGCGGPPTPVVTHAPPKPPPPLFSLKDTGVGPIDKNTPANLTALRTLVGPHGYAVRPINDGGVEYHVFDAAERLFYVIPNDDGSLFNVHVVSAAVPITQHPDWVVGKPLTNSAILTDCECWGTRPVCWKDGEHVALGFNVSEGAAEDCNSLDTAKARESLHRYPIQRAVWSPKPFGRDDEQPAPENDAPEWVPRDDP
ncbi:MAG: hypothetical protein ACKV2T_06570 [Kofleriaceae bacterium]